MTPTRRTFLRRATAAAGVVAGTRIGALDLAALAGAAPSTPAPATPARAIPSPGRLVVVFLRGGQDTLSAVVPYTQSSYYDARPTIAVPADVVLDLDGEWGFHPALPRLYDLYTAQRLAVVVCTGNPAQDESHFGAQDLMEYGTTRLDGATRGWLARALDATADRNDSVFRAVTAGDRVDRSSRRAGLGLPSIRGFGLERRVHAARRPDRMLRAGTEAGPRWAGPASARSTRSTGSARCRDHRSRPARPEPRRRRHVARPAARGRGRDRERLRLGHPLRDRHARRRPHARPARRARRPPRCVPGRARLARAHRRDDRRHDRVRPSLRRERLRWCRPRQRDAHVRGRRAGARRTGPRPLGAAGRRPGRPQRRPDHGLPHRARRDHDEGPRRPAATVFPGCHATPLGLLA